MGRNEFRAKGRSDTLGPDPTTYYRRTARQEVSWDQPGCEICEMIEIMKKQASDQQFHDRRYQERKRAEAAKRPVQKKAPSEVSSPAPVGTAGESTKK
jgi:hypothetical protein